MNRVIVITGGTSGIGLDLKNLFVNNGDTVLTISTRKLDDSNHYSCSVADEINIKQTIDKIGKNFGRIDILINNAGFGMSGICELLPTEQIKNLIDVNYMGTIYTIQSAIKYMERGSKIINISSAMALFPVPFRGIYASAKSAVLTLSFALKMELQSLGIDVTAICPGDVKTNFTKNRIKQFDTNPRYGKRLQNATEKSDNREDKRMSSISCATKVFKIICHKKLKPFYIIGTKYKLLYFATRFTPKSMLLNITNKLYGGNK